MRSRFQQGHLTPISSQKTRALCKNGERCRNCAKSHVFYHASSQETEVTDDENQKPPIQNGTSIPGTALPLSFFNCGCQRTIQNSALSQSYFLEIVKHFGGFGGF
jgi:hypothetical protein